MPSLSWWVSLVAIWIAVVMAVELASAPLVVRAWAVGTATSRCACSVRFILAKMRTGLRMCDDLLAAAEARTYIE